jgi:hypothetical protein
MFITNYGNFFTESRYEYNVYHPCTCKKMPDPNSIQALAKQHELLPSGLSRHGEIRYDEMRAGYLNALADVGDEAVMQLAMAPLGIMGEALLNARLFKTTIAKLQHEFKHAAQFGVTGNWNAKNAAAFAEALNNHIAKEGIQKIEGTYRNTQKVTHYYDPATKLNVMLDKDGNLVGAWELGKDQLTCLLNTGNVQ